LELEAAPCSKLRIKSPSHRDEYLIIKEAKAAAAFFLYKLRTQRVTFYRYDGDEKISIIITCLVYFSKKIRRSCAKKCAVSFGARAVFGLSVWK
jgi:hypothetical protein